ncbi:MAG: hypothetical protein R6V62_04475 [Candidatus Fermentibacteraceae bacterium]
MKVLLNWCGKNLLDPVQTVPGREVPKDYLARVTFQVLMSSAGLDSRVL